MSHDTLNIALPATLKEYVLKQVSEGGYSTASEYVRELIRSDQKRKERDRLEHLVLEGLEGGASKEMTADDWAELKRRVWDRHSKNSVG
ncbi:MAG: type II toxin-antitoxin system ParD family antitoxin [Pirellulales bacterium]